ncbi:MAG TPA: CPBP family intramembrane glutamic endopeptidase [Vicinamibacterales bacterium]
MSEPAESTPQQPSDESIRRPLPLERAAAALEVILCSGFPTQFVIVTVLATFGVKPNLPGGALSPAFVFTLTLLDSLLLIGLVFFFFRAHHESPAAMLFGSRSSMREALVGLALIPASYVVVIAVLAAVQLTVPSLRNVAHNPLQDLAKTRLDALLFSVVVLVGGGVREEIQRGFVLRRFEQYLGGGALGLVLFSAVFGLGHLEQGRDVALATATLGVFWGAIYLRRRSILGPMIGHAGFDLAQVLRFVIIGQ